MQETTLNNLVIKEKNNTFTVEFLKDSFWPYDKVFSREDFYFVDNFNDRWSKEFPYKWINTEIFIENDDIIIWTWKRTTLSWENKNFIDIIHLKLQKKQRIFLDELNLIYNNKNSIFLNIKQKWLWKSFEYDLWTLNVIFEIEEKVLAFFKLVYIWWVYYKLKYNSISWRNYWYFELQKIDCISWEPGEFNRENFQLQLDNNVGWKTILYLWDLSFKKIEKLEDQNFPIQIDLFSNNDFLNNQNYYKVIWLKKTLIIVYYINIFIFTLMFILLFSFLYFPISELYDMFWMFILFIGTFGYLFIIKKLYEWYVAISDDSLYYYKNIWTDNYHIVDNKVLIW